MSGLEIFGAVVGGITLCAQLSRLGNDVREAINRIKNSRRDVLALSDEAVIFAGLSTEFLRLCNEDHAANKDLVSSIYRLKNWIKRTNRGITQLLKKVGALLPDSRSKRSLEERCIARLEWFGSKKSVESLRALMSMARTSIDGFSNLIYIRKLKEELDVLKLALTNARDRKIIEERFGIALEEKIKMVQQSM